MKQEDIIQLLNAMELKLRDAEHAIQRLQKAQESIALRLENINTTCDRILRSATNVRYTLLGIGTAYILLSTGFSAQDLLKLLGML